MTRDKEAVEYTDCFVAYLDILGFKKRVKKTEESLKSLDTLIEALQINSKFTQSDTKSTSDGKLDIRSFFFSDSFVFMMKVEKKNLPHLFFIVRYLQDRLWENGLCLRGAIVKGPMYWPESIKENIILGTAMLEAYKLESKVAIYPRVVITKSLFEYIEKENVKTWSNRDEGDIVLTDFIKKDKDGIYFFDILNSEITRKKGEKIFSNNDGSFSIGWDSNDSDNYDSIVNTVKNLIENGMKNEDETVRQKYEWLKSYLNENSQEMGD